ncbi:MULTISPECIES: O-methyltransferase [unclassified Gordonia (in: high G+C Gram-positive bacteria)]|uniref:O-methyltransferase n=1 Tax=unclassified Gordonia (in: high G+C Gram-positive bacteria) TaxID=2657482 RepID=UPI001F10FD8A|nr:class I SAM-dependent methyltransferase [Gordonia sp. ABSL49_1]MCH5641124.1 class I SAM-dependent methyltransferase [Gordonia sp. ABSL49_1]
MTSTLHTDPVASTIAAMYDDARAQFDRAAGGGRPRLSDDATAQERADAASDAYMPVSPMAGQLMYSLVRATRPDVVVEFGMSYGISTLHLAAAVRDNGHGQVHTTEMSAKKLAAAADTFSRVGLDDVITIHAGDALTTLADLDGPVGFLFLDGWKDMYLPVLELLEDRLPSGTLILADNTEREGVAPYLARVRDPEAGYAGVNFPGKGADTMELSVRL